MNAFVSIVNDIQQTSVTAKCTKTNLLPYCWSYVKFSVFKYQIICLKDTCQEIINIYPHTFWEKKTLRILAILPSHLCVRLYPHGPLELQT